MIRRIRVAWERLRGFEPGARWAFLRRELFELKGIARGVLSEVELVKHELASIREEFAREHTWPRSVTVSVLGQVLLEDTDAIATVITTLVGAETVSLAPSERRKLVFQVRQNIRRGAVVWVSGPGSLENVYYANYSCNTGPGMGGVFIVPRMMSIGTQLDCSVVGVRR